MGVPVFRQRCLMSERGIALLCEQMGEEQQGVRAEPKRSNPRSTEGQSPPGLRQPSEKWEYCCKTSNKCAGPVGRRNQASNGRNRRASNPLSPIAALPLEVLLSGRVSNFSPQKPGHVNPPVP